METYISDYHKSFYIPELQNIALHLSHVHIVGNNHCGNTRHEAFKRPRAVQDVLFHRDYSKQ